MTKQPCAAALAQYAVFALAGGAPVAYSVGDQSRLERLTRNLIRALRDEPILLVLDNFETNLKPQAEPGTAAEPLCACQDPAWDRCLTQLATDLVGTPSRVLITCRRPLAALAGTACQRVLLGPLPAGEATLYLREHAGLSHMIFSGDLEIRHDYTQLPALFVTDPGDAKELAYLNDALVTSLAQLIRGASSDARRLLWMIGVANDPVSLGLLRGVGSGEDGPQQQRLRQIKQMLDMLPQLPAELQEWLKAMPPELRARLDALPPVAPTRPDPTLLLRHLVAVGLATEERQRQDDVNPDLTCHELVHERIRAWMHDHPQDWADLTENTIRLAYAERLEAVFKALQHQNMTTALQAGSCALVYYVRAGAYDRLGDFASNVVTGTGDTLLLAGLFPHLAAAVAAAPEGWPRWRCLGILADALRHGGRPDASLLFYEQTAIQARAAAEAQGENGRQAWEDVAVTTANWANALLMTGDLDASRQRHRDSAEAGKKAGTPTVNVIGQELEALRIDIIRDQAAQALPEVEARLAQVEAWWQHWSGQTVPEASAPEELARVFISALDIAREAHCAQQEWEPALRRIDTSLEVRRALERPAEDIAMDRANRSIVLGELDRFCEAQAELEACLQVFQNDPARRARTLSSLALLFYEQNDVPQAITQERRALALCEQLPDPRDRAVSHNNLANYLKHSGTPSALAESSRHQLAALVYQLITGLRQDLQTSLYNYAILFRRAQAAGTPLTVPRVAELLADPAFRPLAAWLRQRQADVAEVQAAVDQALDMARQAALEQE